MVLLALLILPTGAGAQTITHNDIAIDISGPGNGVAMLDLEQDSANPYNQIAATTTPGSTSKMPFTGNWSSISVSQTSSASKGANILAGAVNAYSGSTYASLDATYQTNGSGNNTHTLNIGTIAAGVPADPGISLSVTNTGSSNNVITDTLNSGVTGVPGTLMYGLDMSGTGITLTNTLAASSVLVVTETISGDNNTITNHASNGSTVGLTETVLSDNNTINAMLCGTGTQSAQLTVGVGSMVNYALKSAGANQTSNVSLSGVTGNTISGTTENAAPTDVVVYQTANATGGRVSLTFNGEGYTAGNISGLGGSSTPLPSNYTPTTGSTGPAIYVYQNTTTAITVNAHATAPGYTLSVVNGTTTSSNTASGSH